MKTTKFIFADNATEGAGGDTTTLPNPNAQRQADGTQNAQNTPSGKPDQGKLRMPAIVAFIGILLSADEVMLSDGRKIILITVQDHEDEQVTVASSDAYWKKVGRNFQPDTVVKIQYEVRVKDITGYKDEAGAFQAHTSDGQNLTSINRFSTQSFQRLLDNQMKDADLTTLNAVEVERIGAVANYLSAYVKK